MDGQVDLFRKVIESSPVIVLLTIVCMIALWRRLAEKDSQIISMMRDWGKIVSDNTTALEGLTHELERRERK
jgi:hypothetical protein